MKDAITIPASALLKTPEGTKVMVVADNGIAEGHVVETGIRDEDSVQITKGLDVGQTIIASGAYGLPDKTHVKAAEAASAEKPETDKAEKPETEKE